MTQKQMRLIYAMFNYLEKSIYGNNKQNVI